MDYLWIGLGSGLGGMARHAVSTAAIHWWGSAFPWGTLIVNVAGSFVIGLAFAVLTPGHFQRLLLPGFLGGFTTFSAFSLQSLQLFEAEETAFAWINILVSVSACLAAVWLGMKLGGSFAQ